MNCSAASPTTSTASTCAPCHQSLGLVEYQAMFDRLPASNRQAVLERWGAPQNDPMCRDGRMMIAGLRLG